MADTSAYKTNLSASNTKFNDMMARFGVVTVMNAKVYDIAQIAASHSYDSIEEFFKNHTAYDIASLVESTTDLPLCTLDTLKTANVTVDGPDKTVNGGQYANPLIKFGKSARLEIQDALGNSAALEALSGGIQEWKWESSKAGDLSGLHFGEDFSGPKLIIGDSFFIEQKTGNQVPVKIIFYQFLPDSLFNLTQDSEGDATVFDMNGDLLTTIIKTGNESGNSTTHGVFYSIIDDALTGAIADKKQ